MEFRKFKVGDMVRVDFSENFPEESVDYYGGRAPFKITKISLCPTGPCEHLGCKYKINDHCYGLSTYNSNYDIFYALKKVGSINCPAIVVKDE